MSCIEKVDIFKELESDPESEISENEEYSKKTIFLDSESDLEESKPIVKKSINVESIIGKQSIIHYIIPDSNNYKFKSWLECFPTKKVYLRSLLFNPKWKEFFDLIEQKIYFSNMEKILSSYLTSSKLEILPKAELVFNAFNILSPEKIRVVVIGQDPYPSMQLVNGKSVPDATGLSFSTPINHPKPESLKHIYENMLHYGHIKSIPHTGNLSSLAVQGFFFINSALTTYHTKRNVHRDLWKSFTEDLLNYLNNKFQNIVFLIWGADAHRACKKILDPKRHCIITSSHPSPLGYTKTFNGNEYGKFKDEGNRKNVVYPSFQSIDHFGRVNDYLTKYGNHKIYFELLNANIV